MRNILLVSLVLAAAAGCATLQSSTRSTEETLSAAGFHMEAADTPEKLADVRTPPPRQLLPQTRDGKTVYVYRDPAVCHCLYVGGEPEYQEYQRLRLQKEIADEQARASANWTWGSIGSYGPWRSWP